MTVDHNTKILKNLRKHNSRVFNMYSVVKLTQTCC